MICGLRVERFAWHSHALRLGCALACHTATGSGRWLAAQQLTSWSKFGGEGGMWRPKAAQMLPAQQDGHF